MKHRSPVAVFFLSLITFGIYGIVWQVKTKNEMKRLGADIPTAWLIIVPFVNIWWLWKYSEGVDKVSKGEMSAVISFILLFVLGVIGMAIIQNEFNKLGAAPVAAGDALADAPAPTEPTESSPAPETPAESPAPAPADGSNQGDSGQSSAPQPPAPTPPPTV